MRSLAAIVLLLAVSIASGQHRFPPGIHETVLHGIDHLLRQEYAAADSDFRMLTSRYPNDPAGYLYRAAVLQTRSIDLGTPLEDQTFDSLLTIARSNAARTRIENGSSVWADYVEATADGYEAVARADRGDWFGAIRRGMASASAFNKVLAADSSFGDAYTGLGAYLYWRSRKTEFLHWLPFVSDDRERGIRWLMRGYATGEYTRFAAVSSLMSVFLDNGDHAQAECWSRIGLASYPMNRVFAWGLATALQRQERYRDAIEAYEALLRLILAGGSANPYDEIVCRLNLVRCKRAASDTSGVVGHLDAILTYRPFPFAERFADRVNDKFDEAFRLPASLAPADSVR